MQTMMSKSLTEDEIRELDNNYSSFGDTVHYSKTPKSFPNASVLLCLIKNKFRI